MVELTAADRVGMVAPTTQPLREQPRPGLYVPSDALSSGVHSKLACIDCHSHAKVLPHAAAMPPPNCTGTCHTQPASDYLQGMHATAAARKDLRAPTCATCHGGHNIRASRDRNSKTHSLNIIKVCGDCHAQHVPTNGKDGSKHIASYLDSVHGRAISQSGLAVAATCADCHGAHKVLPSRDSQSLVFRGNVINTCGHCHVGLAEIYQTSIHGELLAKGNSRAPVCTDCHTAHGITRTDTPAFMLDIVTECGTCHNERGPGSTRASSLYHTYRRSYHGQVTALGSTRAARCSDCHGAHDIKGIDDPNSRLNAVNRVQTCRRCHPQANASFAQFESHADHRDGKRYPLLHGVWLYFIIIMSCAFGFFGMHSLLWFIRSSIDRYRNGSHKKHKSNPHAIQRFTRVDRINHAFVIVSFFGLTLTGLPLFFADQGWARTLMSVLGGVWAAGVLHRVFALMLIGNFIVHFVGLAQRARRDGWKKLLFGPTTMLPKWKDFKDCAGMFRWFFVGGNKPAFDRWTYWEKFDYVAEVFGSLVIAITGLMLWFPIFFSWFLPGWTFNLATLIHGYEALLAIGFIFTIHFFNAHLRMEKFPVDDVMFTGQLPEEEFKHERPAEYQRLVTSGEIEKLRVPPAAKWHRPIAVAAGAIAMAIGTTLVVLIILAGLGVL
jgi:cytochrome b subunit of formate dehydrogenase